MSNFTKIIEFNTAFGVKAFDHFRDVSKADWELAIKLVKEEYAELMAEVTDESGNVRALASEWIEPEKVLKEATDLLYVVYGLFYRVGIDADKVFERVHASNMSKLGDDGQPVRREDGKVIKGPNYLAADLSDFLIAQKAGVKDVAHLVEAKVEDFGTDVSQSKLVKMIEDAMKPTFWQRLKNAWSALFH